MNYKAPDNSLHFIEPEYAHLLPAGSVPITDEEAEALRPKPPAPTPPTKAERIRALEQQAADAQARVTRQSLLALALDKACADPAADGMTRMEVHNFLMSQDNGYSALYTLEMQVDLIRNEPS
jgi:hypothetical protein